VIICLNCGTGGSNPATLSANRSALEQAINPGYYAPASGYQSGPILEVPLTLA